MKPVVNIDALKFVDDWKNAPGKHAAFSDDIGAKKLGYNVSICPPGKSTCPMHNHRINEEMFMILEGVGKLRFGTDEYPLRKGDIIACPAGGRDVAHQIINIGTIDLVYLCLSSRIEYDIVEYPDSNKVGVRVGEGNNRLRENYISNTDVDYYHDETSEILFK